MGDRESPEPASSSQPGLHALVVDRSFLTSRKGLLLAGEVVLTFIILICYLASSTVYLITAPLIEFLLAISVYYVYVTKVVEQFSNFHFPLIDFLRCITAAVLFFAISIYAVTKSNAAAKAAGIFGFIATVVFAFDFYGIFNQLIVFINPQDLPTHTATIKKSTGEEVVPSESESE